MAHGLLQLRLHDELAGVIEGRLSQPVVTARTPHTQTDTLHDDDELIHTHTHAEGILVPRDIVSTVGTL